MGKHSDTASNLKMTSVSNFFPKNYNKVQIIWIKNKIIAKRDSQTNLYLYLSITLEWQPLNRTTLSDNFFN